MFRDIEMENLASAVFDNEKAVQDAKSQSRHGEEVHGREMQRFGDCGGKQTRACGCRRRRPAPDIAGDVALGNVQAKFEELVVNSRRAQEGFSFAIRRMRARTSRSILGLPRLLGRDRRRQNKRKPARCQATTVSGLTMTRTWLHPGQSRRSRVQNTRSRIRSRARGCFRLSTPNCWRRARISRPRL